MRRFLSAFFLLVIFLNEIHAQSEFDIFDDDKTETPVSAELYGSFYELSFGRTDLLWGELLYNRDFEVSRGYGKNGWLNYGRPRPDLEDWWHSGYEEPKWYLWRSGVRNDTIPLYDNNYWPSGHGRYFVNINNKGNGDVVILAQNRIYIRRNCGYNFSGWFSNCTFFSAEKESDKNVGIKVALYANGDFSSKITEAVINVNTNQFSSYTAKLFSRDYEGWATFAIEIPGKQKIAVDYLSLSADDDIKGWKKEPLTLIKDVIRPTNLRFPGGCYSSFYDWRDGVGPREFRPIDYNSFYYCEYGNDVGTLEFIDLCEEIGAKPYFCVPVMFNDVNNALEWLDFCNNPHNERRLSYGRKQPLNVLYWELENEAYRKYDAITYAKLCVDYAKKMKAKDPRVKLIMGNYWVYHTRFKEMLEIAGPYIDMISNRGGNMQEWADDIKVLNEYNKLHGTNITLCHTEFMAPLSRKENEINGLNAVENSENETMFNRVVRWEYAMNVAEHYIFFQNMGSAFTTAQFSNLDDCWGLSLLNIAKEKSFLSASGVVFSLFNSLDVVYPQKWVQKDDNKNVVLQAAWNEQRNKFTIILLNFNSEEYKCRLNLKGFENKFKSKGMRYFITPSSKSVFNTVETPDNIKLEKCVESVSKHLSVEIPAMSLYAIEMYVK